MQSMDVQIDRALQISKRKRALTCSEITLFHIPFVFIHVAFTAQL